MGLRTDQLSPAIFARMAPEDQITYAPQAPIRLPAPRKLDRLEREEHRTFENWLLRHSFAYRHSRTDKATRESCGAPDFTIYQKQQHTFDRTICLCLAIEFKLPGNTLSEAQQTWAAKYGGIVHILATADEAIKLVLREFGP